MRQFSRHRTLFGVLRPRFPTAPQITFWVTTTFSVSSMRLRRMAAFRGRNCRI
jgi:hypothetical protein